MVDDRGFDRRIRRGGIAAAIVVVAALVLVFVIAQNTPRTAGESYSDGYQTAAALDLPTIASNQQIEAACRNYFANGLPSNQASDARNPFVRGCTKGVNDRLESSGKH